MLRRFAATAPSLLRFVGGSSCRAHGPWPQLLFPTRAYATEVRSGAAALSLKEMRVVGAEGSIGVMTPKQALALAAERKLHLVEVAPTASPPVWKLLASLPVPEAPPEPMPELSGTRRQQDRQRAAANRQRAAARPGKKEKPPKVKEVRLSDKCEVGAASSRVPLSVPTQARSVPPGIYPSHSSLLCTASFRLASLPRFSSNALPRCTPQQRDAQIKTMNAIGFLKKGYIVRVIALNTGRYIHMHTHTHTHTHIHMQAT